MKLGGRLAVSAACGAGVAALYLFAGGGHRDWSGFTAAENIAFLFGFASVWALIAMIIGFFTRPKRA